MILNPNPREDKPAFIKSAAVPPQAGWAALTDRANMTDTEQKDKEQKSENRIHVCSIQFNLVSFV